MATEQPTPSLATGRPLATGHLATGHLVGIGTSVAAGLLIWAVGLPSDETLFDTKLSDLTVAAALFVALTGISVVGALSVKVTWRVVDMVVAGVLGVVGGLFLWGVAAAWAPLTNPLQAVYPPLSAALAGLWLIPGVLGGLVIRKPGAALFTELVAAVIEALLGNVWGFATVYYGLVEGLGAEFVLALLLFRRFGLPTALLTGMGTGLSLALLEITISYPTIPASQKFAYSGLAVLSGAVIAGAGAWALTRALATTGALGPLASGRTAERV